MALSEKEVELIKGERKFLHDLANLLVVSSGMGGLVYDKLEKIETIEPKILERLKKVNNASEQMSDMVRKRRQTLIEESEGENTSTS